MAKHYLDIHKRIDQRTPRIVFRLPSEAAVDELQTIALQSSTSVSSFIREAIRREIERVKADIR